MYYTTVLLNHHNPPSFFCQTHCAQDFSELLFLPTHYPPITHPTSLKRTANKSVACCTSEKPPGTAVVQRLILQPKLHTLSPTCILFTASWKVQQHIYYSSPRGYANVCVNYLRLYLIGTLNQSRVWLFLESKRVRCRWVVSSIVSEKLTDAGCGGEQDRRRGLCAPQEAWRGRKEVVRTLSGVDVRYALYGMLHYWQLAV
jgi:hypothetical protein